MDQMFSFASPALLTSSLLLVALTILVALRRAVQVRRGSRILVAAGLLLLALAAGDITMSLPRRAHIAVMVDLSPSTRTAEYRDLAILSKRLAELLPGSTYYTYVFADQVREVTRELSEIASQQTVFAPPPADAVVLFSDGRFESPASAPRTFVVIDPELEDAPDAVIERMEIRSDEVIVSVSNRGESRRELAVGHAEEKKLIEPGSQLVAFPIESLGSPIQARLNPADAWPENDALTIHPPPPAQLERWWVGASPSSGDWRAIAAESLPEDSAAYLNSAVIVVDNVPADALGPMQQDRLMQYVRDLGGGLLILGGDRAFAAGGYAGTALEALSPLSSHPPAPATHWVLLVDSSGSMAAPVDNSTRWRLAVDAVMKALPGIPPEDPVSIGSFARELRWWSQGRSAGETSTMRLNPPDFEPRGPTNLQPALESILAGAERDMPVEILLITDADTRVDVESLAPSIRTKRIRVHLLATTEIPPDNPVQKLVEATAGTVIRRADPRQWATGVRQLLRAASPANLSDRPLDARFVGPAQSLGSGHLERWNHVWPKNDITPLAVAEGNGPNVLGAQWNLGWGQVVAVAFAAPPAQAESLAQLVSRRPRDPRFTVELSSDSKLRLCIDAIDGNEYLNDLPITLELRDAADPQKVGQTLPVPQTAPGRYGLEMPAPRSPQIALVRLEDQLLHRQALARRYTPEFDQIGIDRRALRKLAERTGGRIIESNEMRPIDLPRPMRRMNLVTPLSLTGAVLIALGLFLWKLR